MLVFAKSQRKKIWDGPLSVRGEVSTGMMPSQRKPALQMGGEAYGESKRKTHRRTSLLDTPRPVCTQDSAKRAPLLYMLRDYNLLRFEPAAAAAAACCRVTVHFVDRRTLAMPLLQTASVGARLIGARLDSRVDR